MRVYTRLSKSEIQLLLTQEITLLLSESKSVRDISKIITRSKSAVHRDLTKTIKLYYPKDVQLKVLEALRENFKNRGYAHPERRTGKKLLEP